MKITDLLETSTTAGAVAPVSMPLGGTQTRNTGVYGGGKVGSLFKGKKTNKPFINSVNENLDADQKRVKQLGPTTKIGKKGTQGYLVGANESISGISQGIEEVAPPGAKAERMVKHIKQAYSKDGKLTPKEKAIAYATTWKAHNNGQVEESDGEYSDEVGMAKTQLHTIQRVAKHLEEILKDGEDLPEWVQSKLTMAQDYAVTALDYMASQHEQGREYQVEGELKEDDLILVPGKGRKYKPELLNKPEISINPTDTVKVDIPLLIRLLEYAREDAEGDLDLHDLAEKLVTLSGRGRTLSMKDYDRLVDIPEKVDEISKELAGNYLKGALHDTITGKKDRNLGMVKAMSRISGTDKPLIDPNRKLSEFEEGMVMGVSNEPSESLDMAEGADKKCPPATQDITLNLKNRQKAINEYGYGPLNPDMPNNKFWMRKVDEWNLDSTEEAKQSLCGNCAAFDQRADTLDCIAQGIGSDQGAEDPTIEAGELGYCRFLKFKCASRRTCDAWVTGGPLTDKQGVVEGLERAVDARGRTQEQWAQLVMSKFPGAKITQAKMIDGPMQATLPDGRKIGWKKVEQIDEIIDPSTLTANALRYIGRKIAQAFPWLVVGGATYAASGLLAPIVAAAGGMTAALSALGGSMGLATGAAGAVAAPGIIQTIKDLFSADENSVQAGIKSWVEKYVGDDNDVQEFLLVHSKSAYEGKKSFRWRAKEWPVKLSKDQAEAYLEKKDKSWLDYEKQKIIDAEKAKAEHDKEGVAEESCPHCGGEMVSEELMNEKKDACYYKVKSRYKVWPSAYASGALV
jgi:hypothetical protein